MPGRLELAAEIVDASAFASTGRREARLVGRIRAPAVGDAHLCDGRVVLEPGALVYEGTFEAEGGVVRLHARRESARDTSLADRLRSLRRLRLELTREDGAAPLEAGTLDAERGTPVPFPIVTNAPSQWQRLGAAASFQRVMLDGLLGG